MRTPNPILWAILATLALPLSGCGSAGRSGVAEQKAAPTEASWDAQVEAVRSGAADSIEITKTEIGDEELRELAGLDNLRELLLDRSNLTAEGLAPLAKLPKLEHVRLRGNKVADAELAVLCTIPALQRLNLPQADFTDDGLAALAQLKELQLLRFGSPRVTDAGLAHLKGAPTLRWLHLIDIPITAASVPHLIELPKLESLYLDGAKISDQGFDELFKARPELHVHVDQKHHDRDPHGHSH